MQRGEVLNRDRIRLHSVSGRILSRYDRSEHLLFVPGWNQLFDNWGLRLERLRELRTGLLLEVWIERLPSLWSRFSDDRGR